MTTYLKKAASSPAEPLVSIILLNWNQLEVTSQCLRTLAELTYRHFEVVVLDQASDNNEYELLRERFPWANHIRCETNTGFTGGNNIALNEAHGSLLVLLNNDTEVAPDFLDPLVAAFLNNSKLGIASPQIQYFDAPGRIQYAGCDGINYLTMRGSTRGHGEMDNGAYNLQIPTELAHGAAMMIRREVLEQVGLLGPEFFIYYEEFDFCVRAQREGWEINYVPGSTVRHKESVTVGKASPFKTYYMTRNRLLFLRRNVHGFERLVAIAFVLTVSLPVGLLRNLIHRKWDHVTALIKGTSWHLKAKDVSRNEFLTSATVGVSA
jgi:GT2 family glycosyltransferase